MYAYVYTIVIEACTRMLVRNACMRILAILGIYTMTQSIDRCSIAECVVSEHNVLHSCTQYGVYTRHELW